MLIAIHVSVCMCICMYVKDVHRLAMVGINLMKVILGYRVIK
jgi:hypothetical protein